MEPQGISEDDERTASELGAEKCLAPCPDEDGWFCSRRRGHKGRHIAILAHNNNGHCNLGGPGVYQEVDTDYTWEQEEQIQKILVELAAGFDL